MRHPRLETCKIRRIPLATVALVAIGVIAVIAQFYNVGRAGKIEFDEGVYWQSLRAMSAGHTLYSEIFYSQPPLFLQALYPAFEGFGRTLFGARFGVALFATVGLAGAVAMGAALARVPGALIALTLAAFSAEYLRAARVLQGDGPAIALMFVAAAFALWWWHEPRLRTAIGCGIAVGCALLLKLLAVPIVLFVAALAVMGMLRWRNTPRFMPACLSLLAAVAAGLAVAVLSCFPLLAVWPQMYDQVVSYHMAAGEHATGWAKFPAMLKNGRAVFAHALENPGLWLAGLAGLVAASWRRDLLVIPMLLWLLGSIAVVVQQVPLFGHHHLVIVPPLVALAALGLGPIFRSAGPIRQPRATRWVATTLVVLAACIGFAGQFDMLARTAGPQGMKRVADGLAAAEQLAAVVPAGSWMITDDPFAAAVADRDVPPSLVDISSVRIRSGYITADSLCTAAKDPRVSTISFGDKRLGKIKGFPECVADLFEVMPHDPGSREVWVRKAPSAPL